MKLHPMTCEYPGMIAWPLRTDRPRVGAYGWTRTQANGAPKLHRGVDWVCAVGAPIFAAHAGKIVRAGEEADGVGYGQRVYVQDTATGLTTLYGHMSVQFVSLGVAVRAGHCLGLTGRSGNITSEPTHLHFEVRMGIEADAAVNPEWWLHGASFRERGVPLPGEGEV